MSDGPLMEAPERVLSTLNRDGSRRWLRPKLSKGKWYYLRFILAWGLIIMYGILPFIRINAKQAIFLNLPKREFTLFGSTFLPTDSILLMFLVVGIVLSIFLLTALLGRVWCGWACPQTVYMEFVFRPLERLFEGNYVKQNMRDNQGGFQPARMFKYFVYLLISIVMANIFLAYWVGSETVLIWSTSSPALHPSGFGIVVIMSLMIFADFTYFREQVCIVACPYGRFQSVLLDTNSLIVAYDEKRGEPRSKFRKGQNEEEHGGDCIACNQCVIVCPTGIDIRDGLQLECVHCTQCIDACDEIMKKVDRPPGLIRYGSQLEMQTGEKKFFRPRVILYPLLLIIVFSLLFWKASAIGSAELTMLRGIGTPFTVLQDGKISNAVRVKIVNRSSEVRSYWIDMKTPVESELIAPLNPLVVQPGSMGVASLFVVSPASVFVDGYGEASFEIDDKVDFKAATDYRLLGPLK
jgi:cytochrome c oxidase accessory protein FixG